MKDSQNAIEVENITKKFKVYFDKGNQLKEKILFHNRNRYEEHWVLKGISFQVKKERQSVWSVITAVVRVPH